MTGDSEAEQRVRDSFSRQGLMCHLGAQVTAFVPGECEIRVPFRQELTQQHGYFHAGVTAAIADSACGYAAYSLMPANYSVLTVEYKINLVAPGRRRTLDRAGTRAALRQDAEDLRGGCIRVEGRQRDALRHDVINHHGDGRSFRHATKTMMLRQ